MKEFKNLEVKLLNHFVKPGKEIFNSNIYIKNTGNHDIDKGDVYEPIKISLNDDIIVLDYKLNNYPKNINASLEKTPNKNEFVVNFKLLKREEIIEVKFLFEHDKSEMEEVKWQNNVFYSLDFQCRIKNIKEPIIESIPNQPPQKLYLQNSWPMAIVLLFLTFMYFFIVPPYKLERYFIQEVSFENHFYAGKLGFKNIDTLIIDDLISEQIVTMPVRKFFETGKLSERRYRPLFIPSVHWTFILFSILSISFLLGHLNKVRKKVAIYNFIKKIN